MTTYVVVYSLIVAQQRICCGQILPPFYLSNDLWFESLKCFSQHQNSRINLLTTLPELSRLNKHQNLKFNLVQIQFNQISFLF